MDFEWDSKKAQNNLKKHGVPFEEATTIFKDSRRLELLDAKHSTEVEERSFLIGVSSVSRVLLVVFTLRRRNLDGQETTRIISARPASQKERARYNSQDDT
jgi:uncharacterized protein